MCHALSSLVALALISANLTPVAAQDPPAAPVRVDATPRVVAAAVSSVTLYRGRAAVTRTAELELEAGVYELRFENLPAVAQRDSLQARTAGGLKVLSVDFVEQAVADPATTPEVAELDKRIRSLSQALRAMADQRALIESQEKFLDALTIRTTAEASADAGTDALDLEAVKQHLSFITSERKRLLSEKSSLDVEQPNLMAQLQAAQANREAAAKDARIARSAAVTVVASSPFQGEVTLTYLVREATWQPAYNVRASGDLSAVQVEYDALLTQRTGEDWNEVRLSLSTAQPTVAANPPTLDPFFVDLLRQDAARRAPGSVSASIDRGFAVGAEAEDKAGERLKELAADADVTGSGPSVTFELPRTVTVKTTSDRQQRTRIGVIDSSAQFVHVATPALTEAVYVRGTLTNSSAYQLLPGPAAIFMGQDYIGPTAIDSIAPGGEFKLHFGIDSSVKARKQLLAKTTENTGLLSGGRRTNYAYRLTIDNGSGRDITLELWDRIPVSRTEEIQIQLIDLSTPLASDAHYVAEQQPLGLLKWWLSVPAAARDRSAFTIDYGVRIDRAKDVTMTPLPE